MSNYSKNIVYLSKQQYQDLITNQSITVDGVTIEYNENDIYVTPQSEPVTDIIVAGSSVVNNNIANIPIATNTTPGVVKVQSNYGIKLENNGALRIYEATDGLLKQGTDPDYPVVSKNAHVASFYGLAKASGDATQSQSSNAVGSYTPEAKGAIQSMLGVSDLIATAENSLVASKAYAIGDVFTANGKLYKAIAAIAANDSIVLQNSGETVSGANAVETSVEEGFVKFTDVASTTDAGVVKVSLNNGTQMINGVITTVNASDAEIKAGSSGYKMLSATKQHQATFYGLAKAAGDTTQSASSNAVGTYTDNAKASIKSMLGIVDGSTGTVDVTGAAPTITAVENTRYVCGEVTSLTITPAASGICIIRFTSGSTPTLLTLPSTVKFPEWFDATTLETNTIYEICITDGIYGAVMSWAQ